MILILVLLSFVWYVKYQNNKINNTLDLSNLISFDVEFTNVYLWLTQEDIHWTISKAIQWQLWFISTYCNKRMKETENRIRDYIWWYNEFMNCIEETNKAYQFILNSKIKWIFEIYFFIFLFMIKMLLS